MTFPENLGFPGFPDPVGTLPLLPRSVHLQRAETVKQSGPRIGLGIEVCAEDGERETVGNVKQSR